MITLQLSIAPIIILNTNVFFTYKAIRFTKYTYLAGEKKSIILGFEYATIYLRITIDLLRPLCRTADTKM